MNDITRDDRLVYVGILGCLTVLVEELSEEAPKDDEANLLSIRTNLRAICLRNQEALDDGQ